MTNHAGLPSKDLNALVGEWNVELCFPTDPPGTVLGHASFEWLEEGALLVVRYGSKESGPHWEHDFDLTYSKVIVGVE